MSYVAPDIVARLQMRDVTPKDFFGSAEGRRAVLPRRGGGSSLLIEIVRIGQDREAVHMQLVCVEGGRELPSQ